MVCFDIIRLNLQLFADGGGAGADGGADAGPQGVTPGDAAGEHEKNADQEAAPAAEQQKQPSFDDLLKNNPEYKAAYDGKVQKAIQGRFAKQRQTEATLQQIRPMLEMLAGKYGVNPDKDGNYDITRLASAVEEDDAFYEQEAAEMGLSVEALKRMRKMERENSQLRKAMEQKQQQEQRAKEWNGILRQAEQTKGVYPGFDLDQEMANPQFGRLVANGVPVRTAYEVIHRDAIMGGAMQQVAQQTAQRVANAVQANAKRPAESGMGGGPAATHWQDPTKLTKQDREEIRKQVRLGRKVTF